MVKRRTFTGVPDITEIAHRLRWLRECLGMTQEQFAEHAGLSYKFYQQIESGRKKQVWLETLQRIAAGMGMEVWQLLAPTPPTRLSPSDYPEAVLPSTRWIVAEKPARRTARRARGARRRR